ncbi:helix-turn-helix transcriptional regulator [Hyphomicrobium sp. ghe19]|uniref:helix-turn-helix transcriptional regulator n=1 Tax=Hyphomicrobium sp. ghe19 TaxID=2682968 RepID=UPI0030CC3AEA
MYEPATDVNQVLKPLWHVGDGRMLFAGCLRRNALHSHSASVLLAGLYDDFRLKLGGGSWFSCRAAIIRAGDAYEFDADGRPLAVLYVEPTEASAEGLAALIQQTREEHGALIGQQSDLGLLREIYEAAGSPRWVHEAVAELVEFSTAGTRPTIDVRVARAIEAIAVQERDESEMDAERACPPSVAEAARTSGLSMSRFQHLFKQETGVCYRRYAAWARMRSAVSEVVAGSNFTTAAHAAGFYDQPHFAHEFRRIFGAPASRSLANVRS